VPLMARSFGPLGQVDISSSSVEEIGDVYCPFLNCIHHSIVSDSEPEEVFSSFCSLQSDDVSAYS